SGEVPETYGHQEVERPFVPEWRVALAPRHSDEVPGIESDERQGNHLERRERRGQRHVELGLAVEVPVMPGADQPAAEDQDDIEIDDAERRVALHQAEFVENNADDDRNEQFEEALDPQMDDP